MALDWKLVKLLRGHAAVSLWCYSVSGAERLPVCSLLQPCYSGRMWQRKGGILKRLHLAKTAKVTGAADDVTRHQETRCHLCNNKKKMDRMLLYILRYIKLQLCHLSILRLATYRDVKCLHTRLCQHFWTWMFFEGFSSPPSLQHTRTHTHTHRWWGYIMRCPETYHIDSVSLSLLVYNKKSLKRVPPVPKERNV